MDNGKDVDSLPEAETVKRRDAALKRALSMPPMPKNGDKSEKKKKSTKT